MRNYELKVIDQDGQTQTYCVKARSMARVLRGIGRILRQYGHGPYRQIEISVSELVPDAPMPSAIVLAARHAQAHGIAASFLYGGSDD